MKLQEGWLAGNQALRSYQQHGTYIVAAAGVMF